jgi:hypothetical protein
MRLPRLVVAIIGLFFFDLGLSAQTRVVSTPEQIQSSLLRGSQTEREALSSALHLVIPKESRQGVKADIPCSEFRSVSLAHVTLGSPNSQAVLEAYSWSCQYTYLVVLGSDGKNHWNHIQTIPLSTKDTPPHVSFKSLVSSDAEEMIVQGIETDEGTGISQTNMAIWRFYRDALDVVFDEPTDVTFAIPIDLKTGENSEQSEKSEFTFVQPDPAEGYPKSLQEILQKQVISDHRTTITRWWLHSWDPGLQKFEKHPVWR